VTKADIITEIADKTGIDKNDVATTLEAFFTVLKNNMAEGHNVYVRGFGSFINKRRAAKVGRNIAKDKRVNIPEHYVPSFKPAKSFTDRIKESNKVKLANQDNK
jgi:DNA-binding protein HU-beta